MVYSHTHDANPTLDSKDRNILEQNHVLNIAKYRVAICFKKQPSINSKENTRNEKDITSQHIQI